MIPVAVLTTSGFANVTSGVSDLMSVVTTILTTITGNAILCALFVSGFIGIAISIVRRLKRA